MGAKGVRLGLSRTQIDNDPFARAHRVRLDERNAMADRKQTRRQTPSTASSRSGPGKTGKLVPSRRVEEARKPSSPEEPFPVVGIGASAGGLNALRKLFAKLPHDSGIAYVIVAHLSPEHPSHLPELLQSASAMPVRAVVRTTPLERDHVYVIPPNANLDAIDTHLRLSELEERRRERAPIDHFFRTLAEHHQHRAIGVILSGTGSDGTLGLRRIKELGGLTLVQDPLEAEYDGMPRSAITGAPVDLVLPLAEIPSAIVRYVHAAPQLEVPGEEECADVTSRQFLQKVFAQVHARTGRDFTHYKASTVLRRISRRMQFNAVAEPAAYLEMLRKQPPEVQALANDLLINVTTFFRDPEVFTVLEKDVLPRVFEGKSAADKIRVWSVGCATGEEAYSLAMLFLAEAARHEAPPGIQIFATDLHQGSLDRARDGLYAGDIERDVGSERLKRYFKREPGGHRLRAEVREMVVFAPHNVLADPPFSRLDLVSCRNLLIYLDRALHRQMADLFHYSLNQDGFLVLGTAEGIDATELFHVESKKHCIFRKRNVPIPEPRLPVFPLSQGATGGRARREGPQEPTAYSELHRQMVDRQGPPSVLVSPGDSIVHYSGGAGRYLIHPGGRPTTNVLKLVRDELRIELRTALAAARTGKTPVRTKPALVRLGDASRPVVLDVRPATSPEHDGFVLLHFDEYPARVDTSTNAPVTPRGRTARKGAHPRILELEAEKQVAEERLQQLIEEHETSQEEIRASNEELQSANEELRSTLEELETSKEELQSMNEELHTVNQENRHKVEELGQLSSDLQNLLVATDIATLFLDRELRILRFTPGIEQLFNVRLADRGRSLTDFTSRIGYQELSADAEKVLERLVPVERETQDESGRWYLTRVLPYRSQEDRIDGVVITFVDITRQKHSERSVRQAKETSERILDLLPDPLLVLNSVLQIVSANDAYYRGFQSSPEETIGRPLFGVANGQWNLPELVRLLERPPASDGRFDTLELDHVFHRVGRRVVLVEARRLDVDGIVLLGLHDITRRFEAEQVVRDSEGMLAEQLTARDEYLAMLGHELRNPLGALRSASEFLRRQPTADPQQLQPAYKVIERQTLHMSRIIDGLLDVSRIARGKITVQLRVLDLRQIVLDTVEVRKPHFEKRGLTLEVEVADEPLWVSADGSRLAQAVDNLLGNAIKFTPVKGTVSVTTERRASAALLRVRDTGAGIRREMLRKIFEPFQQEIQDSARTAGGLGLGLALAKGIIELHGGTITATSDGPGTGALFEMLLPLRDAPEDEDMKPDPEEKLDNEPDAHRVLVVEDNLDAADMMKCLLEMSGHTVTVASTGPIALDLLRSRGADLVMCDIGLPGMSGLEFAAAVRHDSALRDIPMIAVSGYGQPEDKKRSRESGFDDHLIKPVDFRVLGAAFERLTRRHEPESSPHN